MTAQVPSIEFFEGLPEELTNVSLRRDRSTGSRSVMLMFDTLKAIEAFNSYRKRFNKNLRLIDSEGEITIEPSSLQFIFGGPEGDDIQRVECRLDIDREDHWERFMRFMHRYAEANGMAYNDRQDSNGAAAE
jgi:photosystem II Psb28-2 protein